MKRKLPLLYIWAWLCCLANGQAQNIITEDENDRSAWEEDDTVDVVDVPIGQYVWRVGERFGTIHAAVPDTLPHYFQNQAFTEGITGRYNTLGNLGSPRISRRFTDWWDTMQGSQFIFERPYDFFITQPGELLFTNTKSPVTNLTYHSCGNKTNGEDRIRAYFAVNAGKRLGMGFKLDYLYGRGYYANQSTAHFGGTLFGSYLGERYKLHTAYYANHLKTAENGGIEDDKYVTEPEALSTRYGTRDMPTLLTKTWNRLNVNTLFLTHRYDVGFHRYRDAEGRIVEKKEQTPENNRRHDTSPTADSLSLAGGALPAGALAEKQDSTASDSLHLTAEFVPVAGFIHTMRIDHNNRRLRSNFVANEANKDYFNDYYLPGDSANDFTKNVRVENTLAFELKEGFNRWVKSGMRLYARHEFNKFTLPDLNANATKYTENLFTVGAQLMTEQARYFRYNVLGEIRTSGTDWGEFNIEGSLGFRIPLGNDTLHIDAGGYVRNEQPSFYYEHYHARNAWWDNDFDKVFRTRIGGSLRYKDTRLDVGVETIQNYTYFQESITLTDASSDDDASTGRLFSVSPAQSNKNVRLLAATLSQDFHWGIFHWENELTYQATSNSDVAPVPTFTGYTNVYLLFRIAKVLRTELGADARYFTSYYAPAYSPIIGQYCVQDPAQRVKTGNYPIINVYANLHLKHCRLYAMASHVNYSSGSGRPFLTPHYPINRLVFRLGLSWNFFN